MTQAKKITDHKENRTWAEQRGGRPTRVKATAGARGGGILRFDFGDPDAALEPIGWEAFFAIFEANGLALLEQDGTAGGQASRFSKFVNR